MPGIPEYIDPLGRGMYNFLTGSASWVILTLVEQIYGIKGHFGDFVFQPKLLKHHFRDTFASINVLFHTHMIHLTYSNPSHLEYGNYQIGKVRLNGKLVLSNRNAFVLTKTMINCDSKLEIILEEKL